MGYYTNYELEVEGSGPVYDKFMREIDNIVVARDNYDLDVRKLMDGGYDEMKWYEHDEDMKQMSSEWPNMLFILKGAGEERGDVWKAWYRNGGIHKLKAKVVFETIQPDLDSILPVNKEFEERMKEQLQKERKERIHALRMELEELLGDDEID